MAVAVKNTPDTKARSPQNRLLMASLVGAVYILGSIAAVMYGVPQLWESGVAPWLAPSLGAFINVALRLIVQVAAAGGLYLFGVAIAGPNPPKGLRAGIFMVITALLTIFFVARAAGLLVQGKAGAEGIGLGVMGGVALGLAYLFFRWFTSASFGRRMEAFEDMGWFHATPYKRSQGVRTRRLTMLGVLVVAFTGIYTLMPRLDAGPKDWTLTLPFTSPPQAFTLLPDVRYTLPLLLAALSIWFAYRVVNFPMFADFLVATEAEMNKVTWTSRKRLIQDTIVVLVMMVMLTVFLFVADQVFGFVLSTKTVGVLPQPKEETVQEKQAKLTPEKQDW